MTYKFVDVLQIPIVNRPKHLDCFYLFSTLIVLIINDGLLLLNIGQEAFLNVGDDIACWS